MLLFLVLLALSGRSYTADARNDTIVHGWVEEPERRGTMSLIYVLSCNGHSLHMVRAASERSQASWEMVCGPLLNSALLSSNTTSKGPSTAFKPGCIIYAIQTR